MWELQLAVYLYEKTIKSRTVDGEKKIWNLKNPKIRKLNAQKYIIEP